MTASGKVTLEKYTPPKYNRLTEDEIIGLVELCPAPHGTLTVEVYTYVSSLMTNIDAILVSENE